jgi:uncharacterized phage protein (TIGR02218 family)
MRNVSSAFRARLQEDGQMAELIELRTATHEFRWTTSNQDIFATLSGSVVKYEPFPGGTPQGIEESSDMGVAVIDFVMANTGEIFKAMMSGGDFSMADLSISRVFVDTPDLDRMVIYMGRIGDYSYNRVAMTGQARNRWGGVATQWPYYTYRDHCGWRFGSPGCGFDVTSVTYAVPNLNVNVGSSTTANILLNGSGGFLSQSFSNGRFDFGRLTVTGGVNSGQVRTIRVHTGDMLSLSHPLSINSLAGATFSIFPGCRKRLVEDCASLYNNAENFLGWPWIPIQETAF